jgi:hypothetical protein
MEGLGGSTALGWLIDMIAIQWPACCPSVPGPEPGSALQNLWTFFCRMHNLSDTPGVGNILPRRSPKWRAGPCRRTSDFKTAAMLRCTMCVRIILLMEASGAFYLKPSPPLADAPLNL